MQKIEIQNLTKKESIHLKKIVNFMTKNLPNEADSSIEIYEENNFFIGEIKISFKDFKTDIREDNSTVEDLLNLLEKEVTLQIIRQKTAQIL